MRIVQVEHLTYHYSEKEKAALQDVSFSIDSGDWVALIGHNGSGKSTLAKNLNGLLAPESGKVMIDGETLTEESVWNIRRKVGIVFQNPDNQFVGATVEDDVAFALENNGVPRDEMLKRVAWALEMVGMTDYAQREPARLSGGQKQRVAIAGIIAQQPKIIILDEATSMLDPKGREEVLAVIRRLKDSQHLTVLSITHDIDEAALANQVLVLDNGQLIDSGSPAEIFNYGSKLIRMGLDVPYPEKLKAELTQQGIHFPKTYLDVQEMVAYLWTLHLKM